MERVRAISKRIFRRVTNMNSGLCSFMIKGSRLDFDEIEKTLKLSASKKFFKGDEVSKVIGKNKFDMIRFDSIIDNENNPSHALNKLIELICPYESYIKSLEKDNDCVIKCFVQSDDAQVNYRLSMDVMKKLTELGVELEISVLSWGGVDEE